MNILLLGADGQVGFALHRALAPLGKVIAATRSGVLPGGASCLAADLSNYDSLCAVLRLTRPQWIVNAAAYTAVDQAEDDYETALRVNGEALGVIGAEALRLQARVLHFSTDYVFSGQAVRPYREDDPVAPVNAYGRSKREGEKSLAASRVPHVILRTAWVYGWRGKNFLRTMLRLAAAQDRLRVVSDQRGAPTTAGLIAQASALVLRASQQSRTEFEPCYHVVAGGETTWHGFATEIVKQAATAGLIAREPAVDAIASADFPTRAQRPAYSVLDCTRLRERLGVELPDWREGLTATIAELAELRRGST
jgi:dTDP-4-dehydrorhamnose reductase